MSWVDELSVEFLLYADGQIILAPSACGLQMSLVHYRPLGRNRISDERGGWPMGRKGVMDGEWGDEGECDTGTLPH
ncbi:hypothetical protein EVAR_39173_1 [Eumeta japonica]|uniref:Uncharacterized protein n=1 Tax=Eumeta variegata TaxID=151549 RepID=A0A4C1VQ80_EUMVA|nr:hypothetical protein EVAR_39173_1 [Eumeta japonica]